MKKTINIFISLHIISIIILFEGLFMISALLVALYYREHIAADLIRAIILTLGIGAALNIGTRKYRNSEPGVRESLVVATLGWVILAFIGTFPYLASGAIPNFVDAYFESMSGFTTTGSSILTDIEALPKSILFWRNLTNWIGGMGIIVLVIAIMPFLKITGMQLFSSEASVVVDEKVSTKVKYVAQSIWMIYVGLTVIETILLWIGGMPLFDSVCHSFATIATGGFSTQNASIAGYSPYIQYVITIFMILSGINFALHVLAMKGQVKKALKNQELHLYIKLIVFVSLLLTLLLYTSQQISLEKAFRDSVFQVATVITATGFATVDYLTWPIQGIILIALLMLVGACAGSTGGGVKVIRHVINFQYLSNSVKRVIHPNAVFNVKYNNKILNDKQVTSVMNFIIIYYGVVILGTYLMILLGNSWATSFGSVLTTMGGVGPGFGEVGPASNFSALSDASKNFLSFSMLLGRLEIFPVISMFTHWFWRN